MSKNTVLKCIPFPRKLILVVPLHVTPQTNPNRPRDVMTLEFLGPRKVRNKAPDINLVKTKN